MSSQPTATMARIGLDEAAARLRIAITRLHRSLRHSTPGGLTQSQWSALVTVETHAPVRVGDVADREGVSAPTATRLVASLAALGLVDREVDAEDRRSAYVSLTEQGRSKLEWARTARTAALNRRLSAMTEDEVARLLDVLPLLEKLATED